MEPAPKPLHNDTSQALERRLRGETEGEVLFDAGSRGRYATDASIYQIMPVGVLVPTCERDITTALAIARELKVPVLPRGGGTSQCGQTTGASLVIDGSKHMRKVLDLNVEARTATVEPGLVLDHLNARLKPHGLWYPVDVSTAAQATLGGMAGNNSCGSRSIAYGNMVHNVLGASAWLSDGELVDFGPVAGLGVRAAGIAEHVRQLALQNDLALIGHYDAQLASLEKDLLKLTKQSASRDFTLLQTTPGIGEYLGLTILHEIGDITRFPTVKDFLSYCRLVKGTVASAGKIKGLRGKKIGNPYLRWAFGEAAVVAKRDSVLGPLAQRLEARLGGNKFKATTVLGIKLARAVYFMLKNKTAFDSDRLVAALSKS